MKRTLALVLCAVLLLFSGCRQGELPPAEETPTPARTVRVAVIDTGFSPDAIPADCVGEGKNYLIPDGTTMDTYGHGTAVASVILDHASNVTLIPLVSNVYEKGKISFVENDVFAGMIRDAVDVYNCEIINISAGLVLDKEAVRLAIAYAEEQGVLVVASAGNDYAENPGQVYYPAAYDSVVAVGALAEDGETVSEFSQRGSWVDLFAPGEEISILTLSGNRRMNKGSSYAAAQVTAAAVGFLQEHESLTPAELRALLYQNAAAFGAKGNAETE